MCEFQTHWRSKHWVFKWILPWNQCITMPGACPTNDISIEFETRPKFAVLWFKMYSTDHNEIMHMSRRVQNFVVIGYIYFKPGHSKIWSNFEFDRNIISGTGARPEPIQVMAWCHQARSHHLNKCWPRCPKPYGIIQPNWVNPILQELLLFPIESDKRNRD